MWMFIHDLNILFIEEQMYLIAPVSLACSAEGSELNVTSERK